MGRLVSAARSNRRPVKIRRSGRHTTPSQVEKVAERAGKAAPAMAIAGVLVTAPQAQHALGLASAAGTARPAAATATAATTAGHASGAALDAVTARVATAAAHAAGRESAPRRTYDVRSGDTLSTIAQRVYQNAADWQWLYHENQTTVSDPNVIYPGEELYVPYDPPANFTLSDYQARHAKAAPVEQSAPAHTASADATSAGTSSAHAGATALSGTLGCTGLEHLWEDAGGNPADAFMAAEIAMAESGGRQYALSPSDDRGYWQINASNGALSTFDAYGNARSAVILSDDGTNWSPWTTFTSGAYRGRC